MISKLLLSHACMCALKRGSEHSSQPRINTFWLQSFHTISLRFAYKFKWADKSWRKTKGEKYLKKLFKSFVINLFDSNGLTQPMYHHQIVLTICNDKSIWTDFFSSSLSPVYILSLIQNYLYSLSIAVVNGHWTNVSIFYICSWLFLYDETFIFFLFIHSDSEL